MNGIKFARKKFGFHVQNTQYFRSMSSYTSKLVEFSEEKEKQTMLFQYYIFLWLRNVSTIIRDLIIHTPFTQYIKSEGTHCFYNYFVQ